MEELSISVRVNLGLVVEKDSVRVSVKNVELQPAMVSLPISLRVISDVSQPEKRRPTLHDIIAGTARKLVAETRKEEFPAAELLHRAERDYPELNPRSFRANVIAAAPEHPSWKHYSNKRNYLVYLGNGQYRLRGVEDEQGYQANKDQTN